MKKGFLEKRHGQNDPINTRYIYIDEHKWICDDEEVRACASFYDVRKAADSTSGIAFVGVL